MPQTIEVKIPDIGDFKEVAVIEVLVKPGDVIKAEDSIVTLESEKASMDVPAPSAGTVKAVKVKVGDMVAEGTVGLMLEASDEKATPASKPAQAAKAAAPGVVASPEPATRSASTLPAGRPPAAGHAAGRAGLCEAGAQRRPPGRRRRARSVAVAEGGLRQVRLVRDPAAVAHPETVRRQSRAHLGDDSACHAVRRSRHHRARTIPGRDQPADRAERRQSDGARLSDQGQRGRAQAVSDVQQFARWRESDRQALLPYWFCRRHTEWPGGAGDPQCRPEIAAHHRARGR